MIQRLIVVVTGANSGVGFATCQRLLVQLSVANPPDAQPHFNIPLDTEDDPESYSSSYALTLIMTCRNLKKAESARQQLYKFIDTHLARRAAQSGHDEHAKSFRENLKIDLEYCDLAMINSVLECAKSLRQKYPYISHLICNAGSSSIYGLNWYLATIDILTQPFAALTMPMYSLQSVGDRSIDGLGWVWQCNVFGHYVLYREIQDVLSAYTKSSDYHHPARVLWTSSMEAVHFYHSDDWQLLGTREVYQSSKYQIDLIGTQLDMRAMKADERTSSPAPIRHFVVQPGIAHTGFTALFVAKFMQVFMLMSFYFARFLGSPHHVIDPFKAAKVVVHVSLAPLQYLPNTKRCPTNTVFSDVDSDEVIRGVQNISGIPWVPFANAEIKAPIPPFRFGSECDWRGRERVGLTRVKQWNGYEEESKVLLDRCEKLYQTFLSNEGQPPDMDTFRGMN